MVEMGFVILGAILLLMLVLTRAVEAQEPPPVVAEVLDDAQVAEALRLRPVRDR
jgi:hypothetical protein